MKSLLCLVVVCAFWSTGSCLYISSVNYLSGDSGSARSSRASRETSPDFEERSPDLEEDLVPWSFMKRDAGYYTYSGRYRGGLYKRARDEELKCYDCTDDNGQFCLTWTTNESRGGKSEHEECKCDPDPTSSYCESWTCIHKVIRTARCKYDFCRHEEKPEEKSCACVYASRDDKFCWRWTCTKPDWDNAVDYESYSCSKLYKNGRFCERWTGSIFSSTEVESVVCECVQRGENHCRQWLCKERRLKMCEEGASGWCNVPLAVGLAGGFGVVGILAALGCSTRVTKYHPVPRPIFFLVLVTVLCLPWTAAVTIWGGVRGVMYVGIMWGAAFLISGVCLYHRRHY